MRAALSCIALAMALASVAAPAGAVIVFDEQPFGQTVGAEPSEIVLFDLDADGDRDVLAAAGSYDDQVHLYRAQPAGVLTEVALPGPGALGLAEPADVTGDGRPDVVYARGGQHADSFPPRGIVVQPGLVTGVGAPVTTAIARASDVATGDFDGDAYADAVVSVTGVYVSGSPTGHYEGGGFTVLHGRPDGTFDLGQSVDSFGARVYRVAVGDIDGGGQDDAVLLTDSGTRVLLGGAGPGGVPTGVLAVAPVIDAPTQALGGLEVTDVDDDGRDDVVSARCCEEPLGTYLRRGRSDGALEAPELLFVRSATDLALGDIDDDANLDILGVTAGGVAVAFGEGDGTFAPEETFPVAGEVGITRLNALAVADMTADGIDDLVVGDAYSSTGVLSLLRNAPFLTVSELELDFGDLTPGQRVALPLSAGNLGIAPLNLTAVEVSGPGFAKPADGCSGRRLEFGETCDLQLSYTNVDYEREDFGQAVFVSDDVQPRFAVDLFGFGVLRPAPPPPPPAAPPPSPPPALPPPPPPAPPTAAVSAGDGLRAALAALRRQGIAGLRTGRVRFSFTAPAGAIRAQLRGPSTRRAGRQVAGALLATGSARPAAAGRVTVRLKPTALGRVRLRRARQVATTLRLTVKPTGATARTRSGKVTLRTTRLR